MALTVNHIDTEENFKNKFIDKYGVKTPCVSIDGGSLIFDEVLDPFFSGITFLIHPDRSFWSSYNKVDNYHAGLGTYQNAISGTLNELGVKPHDHKVPNVNTNLTDTHSGISLFVREQSLAITIPQEEFVEIKLFCLNGRLVNTIEKRMLQSGVNIIPLSNELSGSIYMVSIEGRDVSFKKQLVIP